MTECDRGNCLDGLRSAVPGIRVLVDCGWERRDVELVGCLAIQCPWCAFSGICVNEKLELAIFGVVGGNVERDLGVLLVRVSDRLATEQ